MAPTAYLAFRQHDSRCSMLVFTCYNLTFLFQRASARFPCTVSIAPILPIILIAMEWTFPAASCSVLAAVYFTFIERRFSVAFLAINMEQPKLIILPLDLMRAFDLDMMETSLLLEGVVLVISSAFLARDLSSSVSNR